MNTKLISLGLFASASLLPIAAQPASAADARPMYLVLPPHGAGHQAAPGHHPAALQTWAGSITYKGLTHDYTMVGTNPKKSNATTTVTVYLIPVKLVYGANNGNMTFDPLVDQQNGVSIMQNLLNSPLFGSLDWNWGGTDFGTTQYLDAFQRGSFWKDVSGKNPNYHVVLAPTVLSEVSLTVTAQQGSVINNPMGAGVVGTFDLTTFDADAQSWIQSFSSINPSALAVFVTDNIYLTISGKCCVGGYDTVENSGQTYTYATYETAAGSFSQDISGFSRELGNWMDDPFQTSTSPCGALDVGAPAGDLANYGTFPVTFGGVTWHPQDLAWLEYFAAPKNFSGNNWLDDQHLLKRYCQGGQ
jgi:hypothetical protein